jgi:hypothetical protein
VEAEHLEFRGPPDTNVGFTGTPGRKSITRTRRTNLPDRVVDGVDYREVRIEYLLATMLRSGTAGPSPPGAPSSRSTSKDD